MSVFIDLTKAFDTISHSILLKKIDNLGIRGIANKWFKSYLTDIEQYMNFGNSTSQYEQLLCRIPPGSILGPILFLIYDIQNATCLNILRLQVTQQSVYLLQISLSFMPHQMLN